MSFYGDDLAHIHEAGFSGLARSAAHELHARLDRPSRVVDVGCGGGTLAGELVALGHTVLDVSPAMVALARARVPAARFDVADLLAVRLPPCDAMVAVGEVLNYALAERPLGAADGLFARMRHAIAPGGLLLFDVGTVATAPVDRTARSGGEGWSVEAHVVAEGDRLVRRIETRRRVFGRERATHEEHRQRLLDPTWVEERLESAGFLVERLDGYAGTPFGGSVAGFLATAQAH